MNEEDYQAEPINDNQVIEPPEGTELEPLYNFGSLDEWVNKDMSLKGGAEIINQIPGRPPMNVVAFPDGRTFTMEAKA